MQYMFVTQEDLVRLRKQRLRSLELDHCTAMLALEENPGDPLTQGDLIELERRITHHRGILSPPSEDNGATEDDQSQ